MCGCEQPLYDVAASLPGLWLCVRQHESVPVGSCGLVPARPRCHIDFPCGGHARPLPFCEDFAEDVIRGAVRNVSFSRKRHNCKFFEAGSKRRPPRQVIAVCVAFIFAVKRNVSFYDFSRF